MDLSTYDLLDTFTLHDVAYLLCGYEPLAPGLIPNDDPHEVIRHKASTVADQLVNDAKTGKLVANKRDIGEAWYLAGAPEWIVTRQALQAWATAKGIKPAFLFPKDVTLTPSGIQRMHSTEYLEIMEEAIQKFWEKHDPNRPPKKDEVTSWLEKEKYLKPLPEAWIQSYVPQKQEKAETNPALPRSSNQAIL